MIISESKGPLHIWRPLIASVTLLVVWDVGVTLLYYTPAAHFDGIDVQFTLYGTAIGLFVGFMVNAAYGRWWEARILWGQVVNSSRSLARQALVLMDDDARPAAGEIVRAQIGFVHILRTQLRRQELPPEAGKYLDPQVLAEVRRQANPAAAVLLAIDRTLAKVQRASGIGEIARVQMESTLVALTDAQGGLERINNTPLPVHYRFLPRFIARAFCVVLPFTVVNDLGWVTPIGSGLVSLMFVIAVQIGDDLADPFTDSVHDIPMTALCRTIEVDLNQVLGEEPPAPVTASDKVLW